MLIALLLFAQAASTPSLDDLPRAVAAPALPAGADPARDHLANCLAQANAEPDDALDTATDWLNGAKGGARTDPELCLGTAFAGLGRWEEAEAAFFAGRDAAAPGDHLARARAGIMAGNAALGGGAPVAALAALDQAKADVAEGGDKALLGGIAIDRARALVLLKRMPEAAAALADARTASPEDPAAWLLSATLARRMGHLAEAQGEIEAAARLAPTDPAVGLEAGVIAELAGREDAARRSWQSVVVADPEGAAGKQAAAYLRQIGPGAAAGPANAPVQP